MQVFRYWQLRCGPLSSRPSLGCPRNYEFAHTLMDFGLPPAARDAIDAQLGAELKPAEDASGGNEEMTRATWDNLLGFMNFEEEDFERAKEATARCGPGREVPKAGI